MGDVTTCSDNEEESMFVANFPSQIHWTRSKYFPIRVFWSEFQSNSSSSSSSSSSSCFDYYYYYVGEKIKSALSNISLSHLSAGLIQFWAPVKVKTNNSESGRLLLSTSDQPFAVDHLDPALQKYRLTCTSYHYSIDDDDADESLLNNNDPMFIISGPTPTATAFLNHFPELLLNLRVNQGNPLARRALECGFTTSLMLPVFDHHSQTSSSSSSSSSSSCVGVIECCMKWSKGLLALFNSLRIALQDVDLNTFLVPQGQPYERICGLRHAIDEVEATLPFICASHDLPLAQVWIAYEDETNFTYLSSLETKPMFGVKLVGHYDDSYDDLMTFIKEYRIHCGILPLKFGDGLAGKTLETHKPYFCTNVYELRNYGFLAFLSAKAECSCFTICLRSIHTGKLHYAFEFLWPASRNYLILLDSLLLTLKRLLPSFKFDDELRVLDVENSTGTGLGSFKILDKNRLSQIPQMLEERRRLVADCMSSREEVKQTLKEAAHNHNESVGTLKCKSKISDLTKQDNRANQEHSSSSNSVMCLHNDELIIEAEYEDQRALMYLPVSSKLAGIKKHIDDKYKLGSGRYKLHFLDFENDWIRLDDDRDWESCIISSTRSASTLAIQLRVHPILS